MKKGFFLSFLKKKKNLKFRLRLSNNDKLKVSTGKLINIVNLK